ncbi:hypothetical protein ACEPAI_19 [Sanghuangporus weigelae]
MHFPFSLAFALLFAVLPSAVSIASYRFNITVPGASLEKCDAFNDARFTYYDITTGVTACGWTFSNNAEELIVALNSQQFVSGFPGPSCGHRIRIDANGKSVDAVIVDECPDCPYAGLDLTEGLFSQFADLDDANVITGSWDYI